MITTLPFAKLLCFFVQMPIFIGKHIFNENTNMPWVRLHVSNLAWKVDFHWRGLLGKYRLGSPFHVMHANFLLSISAYFPCKELSTVCLCNIGKMARKVILGSRSTYIFILEPIAYALIMWVGIETGCWYSVIRGQKTPFSTQ